jgi:hypothetical protein
MVELDFLGKPMSFWVEVKSQIDDLNLEKQIEENRRLREETWSKNREISKLKGKLSFYQDRVRDALRFEPEEYK